MRTIAAMFLALTAALAGLAGAQASDITAVRFGEHEGHTRIVIETRTPVQSRAHTLSEPAPRLVVSFEDASWSVDGLDGGAGFGAGLVGVFRFDAAASHPRLVFTLTGPASIRQQMSLDPAGGGYRTVIDVEPVSAAAFASVSGFPQAPATLTELVVRDAGIDFTPAGCERIRVVIDPGHGGRDPGALARFGGMHEAGIALAAGLQLRDILNETGRYEVIMTRDRDVYVSLEDRVRIARQARADLFISLHADSAGGNAGPSGATIYSMNARAENRARSRAINEGNWVDVNRTEEVSRILVEMAISNKRSQSELFAEALRTEVGRTANLWRSTPMEANYAVLTDAEIPAVLFEMGFMTNREDSRRLNDVRERRRLMQAAAAAIDSHFSGCRAPGRTYWASGGSPASGASAR
ncbi:N-acetylmuramoyl-L-alanine amidase [Alkalicaulis satelles]|uniref:N-acetylmuramoyl-L-alanine amidase n=1 Tax=Alkalicaulis satelles TaxID=2609175 RepID=A0A5M6ZN45_9PROT|nr:N-acetylmuramoyl-L-alanine amidase [Alkalicaulis satelles]KAA5804668.1 N-acetylmuramoyl-L-alanine amidase [Alkalicaulis satelles]